MSDSVSPLEEHQDKNKFFGRHKWRGKLLSADGKFGRAAGKLENADEDIANFLHTAGSRLEAEPRSAPLTPPLDVTVGSRQPSATSVDQDSGIVDVYRRPKPRQNKGLCVRFESAPPLVIGVGGDEAELPSREVSKSFADLVVSELSPIPEQSKYDAGDQHPEAYGRPPTQKMESYKQPQSLQKQTRVDGESPTKELRHVVHDQEAVQSGFAGMRKLSSPHSGDEPNNNMYLSLRKREVRNVLSEASVTKKEVSHDPGYDRETAELKIQGAAQHFYGPPSETLVASSLNPSDSPESPYVFPATSSSSYEIPSVTQDLPKLPDALPQDSEDVSQRKYKQPYVLNVAKSIQDDSLEDFDLRVRRFNDLFRLNASAHVDIMTLPFELWVRTSAWWFLRGRGGLEIAVRTESSAIASDRTSNDGELSSTSKQAYFSLAKAWWILKDVIPNLPAMRRLGSASKASMAAEIKSFEDKRFAELFDVHTTLLANMHGLVMSMKRNGRLPPNNFQMQRLESQIFLKSQTFPPELALLMVNNLFEPTIKSKKDIDDPFFPILVGDTSRHFSFCSMFVDVLLNCGDETQLKMPCVVSILRERTDWAVKAAVASPDGQINLVIQSSRHGGLDWHGVEWRIPLHTMQLRIAEGICLEIKFSKNDFKTVWGICDYTQRIRKEYSAMRGEEIIYERELPIIQVSNCPSFPVEPVKNCKVRLFESTTEDNGQQGAHAGHRLMVVTPSGTKTLSKVNYHLVKDSPLLFGIQRSKGGNSLLVRVPSSLKVFLTFHETSDVQLFRSILSGTSITEDDHCSASLQLQNIDISPVSTDQDFTRMSARRWVSGLNWHSLRVVNREPTTYGRDSQSKLRSKISRILTDCDFGTFTDRINCGLGELQLHLSVENLNVVKLLRAAHQDMTWSFADSVLQESELSSLSDVLHSMTTSLSTITYHFRSLPDLHSFQAMLTGFHVQYDGLASTFSISRRRMVVPVHKRWEASTPRLQIIKQDKTVQLVAFFTNFSHGVCMNFVLKVTDSFETFTRSGTFFLRIVDAKFSLPKGELDPTRDFVCLDMPEFPGEHDDIIIGFDNEQDRNKFTDELPAPVNKVSRMVSLRR